MNSLLLCPSCGGGLATRRGMRLHLESHGLDGPAAFELTAKINREAPPSRWKCGRCRRTFETARGLFRHARVAGHLEDAKLAGASPG